MSFEIFSEKKLGEDRLATIRRANTIIEDFQKQGFRMTLRQLYYQFVSRNLITNEEKSYKNLASIISDGRLCGLIDWDAIEDRGRVADKPYHTASLEDHLDTIRRVAEGYTIDKWRGQDTYVELWVEKQALAGVLEPLARQHHITLMVNKGYCVAPKTKVLTSDLEWVDADTVKAGQMLLGPDEKVPGHRKHRRLRISEVRSATRFSSPRMRVTTDRGSIVVSTNHPFLAVHRTANSGYSWIEAERLKIGTRIAFLVAPWKYDASREAGWLAGLYDGEGWLHATTPTARHLGVCQKSGRVEEELRRVLERREGWLSSENLDEESGVHAFMTYSVTNVLPILGSIRPIRLLETFKKQVEKGNWPAKSKSPATVLKIERLMNGPVVGIETSTGTLITDGFLSHNSSQSAMYESAQRFREGMGTEGERVENAKPNEDAWYDLSSVRNGLLLYLGDHDPSGEDMVRDIRDRLQMFGCGDRLEVVKVALTKSQIRQYNPPPNPAKVTDPRAAAYIALHGNSSWEVDALDPPVLARLVTAAITLVRDSEVLSTVVAEEKTERERLKKALAKLKL